MKLSEGVEWGLHCAALLALLPLDDALPARRLAEFHGVPDSYLSKHLQAMARAGLVVSSSGPRGGFRLARPAAEITVLDVVEAIESDAPIFQCTEIRQRGPSALAPSGYTAPCSIHAVMRKADLAWRDSLRSTSIADLATRMGAAAKPRSVTNTFKWLGEVLP